jgi:SET domain-containing protein
MNSRASLVLSRRGCISELAAFNCGLHTHSEMNMAVPVRSEGEPVETEWLTFRSSSIHGLGAFARRPIPRGTQVIEYVGEKIDKQESLRRCEANNEFIFTLDDHHDLDGSVFWNPARWINHSCEPNCKAEVAGGRIWIASVRPIGAGEEITFNYGFDLVDYRQYACHCGAPGCAGYMVAEEFFDHVRKAQKH